MWCGIDDEEIEAGDSRQQPITCNSTSTFIFSDVPSTSQNPHFLSVTQNTEIHFNRQHLAQIIHILSRNGRTNSHPRPRCHGIHVRFPAHLVRINQADSQQRRLDPHRANLPQYRRSIYHLRTRSEAVPGFHPQGRGGQRGDFQGSG